MLKTTFEKVTMHLIRLSNLYLIYAKSAFFSLARLKHVIMTIFFFILFYLLYFISPLVSNSASIICVCHDNS